MKLKNNTVKHWKFAVVLVYCFVSNYQFVKAQNQTDEVAFRVAKYQDDKACAISFTYDDGLREHYTLVTPEMKKRNLTGTFWINGARVNTDDEQLKDTTRVSWKNLQEMAALGHEISNHGWSHKKLTTLTPEEIQVEIEKNDRIILEKIGIPSRTFCYANNAKNDIVLKMASANRVGTRTRQYAVGSRSTPEKLKEWVEKLIEANEWGVEMIHGITYGYDAFTSADILWEHFDNVKALEDKIWVGTFREVAAYIEERNQMKLNIRKAKSNWLITPELSLNEELFTEPLTMVVEKKDIRKITAKQHKKKLPVQLSADKAIFKFNPYGGVIQVSIK